MNIYLKLSTTTLILFLSLSLFSSRTFAQDTKPNRELGLHFFNLKEVRNLENFSISYKKERSENKFFRVRVSNLTLSIEDDLETKPYSASFGISTYFGWEKRRALSNKFYFVHGIEPSISFGYTTNAGTSVRRENMNATIGLGYILGLQADISKRIGLTIETTPRVTASAHRSKRPGSSTTSREFLNARLNLTQLKFTLAYRFNKSS